jgi:hypothetical protein
MNIFKVFASAQQGFQETHASSLLAWLLNPGMDHGLGFNFLSEFVKEISDKNPKLKQFDEILTVKLRTDDSLNWNCYLEQYVGTATIDVVFVLNDWVISIENKIRIGSVKDGQLIRQYKGLKQKFDEEKIGVVYLVPFDAESGVLNPKIETEFEGLDVNESVGDFKTILTWTENEIYPSVSSIIKRILKLEEELLIDPIPEMTTVMLKSLVVFIEGGFEGYPYEKQQTQSGLNPLADGRKPLKDLKLMKNGFVGVKDGISGMLKMSIIDIRKHQYQYSKNDMSGKRNWISLDQFLLIADWRLSGTVSDKIEWECKLNSKLLYEIAKDFKGVVFIGIDGGSSALNSMTPAIIKQKSWSISRTQGVRNWISGSKFNSILDKLCVF